MIHERIPIINVRCHSGQENATRTRANIGIWNYSAKSGILCIIDEGHLSYEKARRIAVTLPHSDFPPSILTKCVLQWLRQKVKFYEIFSECICVTGVNLLRLFFPCSFKPLMLAQCTYTYSCTLIRVGSNESNGKICSSNWTKSRRERWELFIAACRLGHIMLPRDKLRPPSRERTKAPTARKNLEIALNNLHGNIWAWDSLIVVVTLMYLGEVWRNS